MLQAAFGWWDCHLHEFEIGGVSYEDGESWGSPPRDETRVCLGGVAEEGSSFLYWYPACTGGRRVCPPEDCGGVWGYEAFLAAISDPDHDEHDSMLEWVGGSFDPDAFDPADFEHRLRLGRLAAL